METPRSGSGPLRTLCLGAILDSHLTLPDTTPRNGIANVIKPIPGLFPCHFGNLRYWVLWLYWVDVGPQYCELFRPLQLMMPGMMRISLEDAIILLTIRMLHHAICATLHYGIFQGFGISGCAHQQQDPQFCGNCHIIIIRINSKPALYQPQTPLKGPYNSPYRRPEIITSESKLPATVLVASQGSESDCRRSWSATRFSFLLSVALNS